MPRVSVSPESVPHLILALEGYRMRLRVQAMSMPAWLVQVEDDLRSWASGGQPGTTLDEGPRKPQPQTVDPILLTYADAATALACSERQVKRLVADGSLRRVAVGGAARVHIDDVRAYANRS